MTDSPATASENTTIRARALLLGERIQLRPSETLEPLGDHPPTVRIGEHGIAVLFRFGAVVLFGVTPPEEAPFLAEVYSRVSGPLAGGENEEAVLRIEATEREWADLSGTIHLRDDSLERLQVVADILAKSVVLAHYEAGVGRVFDQLEPLTEQLQKTGRGRTRGRDMVRQIADVLLVQLRTVGRAEIIDKPELLWERPDLDRLYQHLEDEYEIRERQQVLDHKLEIVSRASQTYLNLLHNRRGLRVEWYIVLLILVDILLSAYEMFLSR